MIDPQLLIAGLRIYLEANLLLAIGAGLLWLAARIEAWSGSRTDGHWWLRVGQLLFVLALVLPWMMALLPRAALIPPSAQIWSGGWGTARGGSAGAALVTSIPAPGADPGVAVSLSIWMLGSVCGLMLLGIVMAAARYRRAVRRLEHHLAGLPRLRDVGRVRVLASDDEPVPYSAWLRRKAFVVVPLELVMAPTDLRMALQHELQHHRQGDTRWVHVLEAVRALCFWNPAMPLWSSLLSQFQEFACDAQLVGRRRVSAQAYGRCLLKTAQSALSARGVPVGTAGMVAGAGGPILTRRIEMMIDPNRFPARRWLSRAVALGAVLLLSSSAFASRSAVLDRTLAQPEAVRYAVAVSTAALAVPMNEAVLEKLNRFAGTPKGREFIRGGLSRLPEHRMALEKTLVANKLPVELLAVPLIESGFRNMGPSSTEDSAAPGPRGAGIWMFIPQTAQKYGLSVDKVKGIDERLDVTKETEAAMRLLSDLMQEFGSLELALAGYNQGAKHVREAIASGGTRDAWQLVQAGKLNDYLPTVMAGIILIKHPDLVE